MFLTTQKQLRHLWRHLAHFARQWLDHVLQTLQHMQIIVFVRSTDVSHTTDLAWAKCGCLPLHLVQCWMEWASCISFNSSKNVLGTDSAMPWYKTPYGLINTVTLWAWIYSNSSKPCNKTACAGVTLFLWMQDKTDNTKPWCKTLYSLSSIHSLGGN